MGSLGNELRKVQMVVFDRFMRSSENPDEPRLLAEASTQIPKDRRVVVVDSDLAYGNARSIALDLRNVLEEDELIFLAYDQSGLDWADSHGLQGEIFSTKAKQGSAELWNKILRAKVSVYDSHNWWRTRDQLIQRSLLEGSYKVQLWHGATGPVGKAFGLERLDTAASFWHFSAVATSSVGFDVLVNEPTQAEYRRSRSMLAAKSVFDVEYRLVNSLNSGEWSSPNEPRLLIAPTYSESTSGEDALEKWINEVASVASENNWKVDLALHPGAKPRMNSKARKIRGVTVLSKGVETANLRNYSAVVTDFSGIAHDALMLGIPTVSVLVDFQNYQNLCPSIIDEAQMEVAYVVNELGQLGEMLLNAMISDSLREARNTYLEKIVESLGAIPGVNSREAILSALDN